MKVESVLLCVDDSTRRALYAAAIGRTPDLVLLRATAAVDTAERTASARQPDVVLVEAARPWLEGAKVVARVRELAPRARVVAVAAVHDRPRTLAARSLVADRYVDPDDPIADIVEVLRQQGRQRDARRAAS